MEMGTRGLIEGIEKKNMGETAGIGGYFKGDMKPSVVETTWDL